MLVWLCCGLAAGAEDRPGMVLVPWAAQNISDHCWVNAAGAAENSFKPLTTIIRPGKGWGRCLDPFGAGLGVLPPVGSPSPTPGSPAAWVPCRSRSTYPKLTHQAPNPKSKSISRAIRISLSPSQFPLIKPALTKN